MENSSDSGKGVWRFLDGSVSISISMMLAVGLNYCWFCAGVPGLGFLYQMTNRNDGIIIVATMLLLPTTAVIYGGFRMYFAAKEHYERRKAERLRQEAELERQAQRRERQARRRARANARQEGRQEGLQEGRQEGLQEGRQEGLQEGRQEGLQEGRQEGVQEERQRINTLLVEHGVALPPELARSLAGDTD